MPLLIHYWRNLLGIHSYLVGGLDLFLFSIIYGIVLPIDFHTFQRGRYTTNQVLIFFIDVSAGRQMIGDLVHDAGIPEILTTDLGYGKIDGFNYRETLGKYGHFFRFGN